MGQMRDLIPVTVLTGFLGSGKTTLLNHLLRNDHGRKIGVIVNEFGALGIDGALIRGAHGDVIELANGCICCATYGELSRTLRMISDRPAGLDALIIETSGLADPVPVITELNSFPHSESFRLDSVVTIVDAANFDRNLDSGEAAYQQIVSADLVVINKIDLVDAEIPTLIEQGIKRLNSRARFIRAANGDVPMTVVFDAVARVPTRFFSFAVPEKDKTATGDEDHHEAHRGFTSVSIPLERPLDLPSFITWLENLGPDVFRIKGFTRFRSDDALYLIHVVGDRYSITPMSNPEPPPFEGLVVIGKGIASNEIKTAIDACVASP